MTDSTMPCPVCLSKAKIVYSEYPGYQEPQVYDILHCQECDTSFANPLEVNSDLYDLIYSKSDEIHGYNRYNKYAEDVLNQKSPLAYLAKSEATYWCVKDYLDKKSGANKQRILEVGCGLGYLTYSLIKAGFNTTGLDISINSVERAKAKYGNYFVCADLESYKVNVKYDIIILTEVIEHLPNVYEILNLLNELLAEDGKILITTPNKSSYPENIPWFTDLPPVHLWWFSEKSMLKIADNIGFSVEFTDFSKCNSLAIANKIDPIDEDNKLEWIGKSQIDDRGSVIASNQVTPYAIRTLKMYWHKCYHDTKISSKVKSIKSRLPWYSEKFIVGKRREILCAILSRE